jgi:ParB family chromosome partitioning protein
MSASKSTEEPRRLGRGLAALIGDSEDAASHAPARGQKKVPIEFLRPNPRNPRKTFDEIDLEELAASIKEKGILQPILARPAPGLADAYEIIAGERRWRAAQRAGLHDVPIIVVEADDRQALELAIIENVQRSDLNPLEEASGYERLSTDFKYSHGDVAKVIGKSRSHVANSLRLLKLPELTRRMLAEGHISAGHARALLAAPDPDALAVKIAAQGLSVRDVESILQSDAEGPKNKGAQKTKEKDVNTRSLETSLSVGLGLKVTIVGTGERGELRIAYKTLEQLDGVIHRLQPG